MKEADSQLMGALKRLQQSAQKIVETRGYTREAGKIRMLEELIREQLKGENTRTSARPTR